MPAPSLTYTLINGTTADASQVMQDFNDLHNGITDGTKDLSISGLTVAGVATLNGNVILGNATADDITITGSLASNIPIKTTNTYGIGSSTLGLSGVYFGTGSTQTARIVAASSYAGSLTYTLPDLGAAGTFAFLEGTQTFTGNKTFSGTITPSGGVVANSTGTTPSSGFVAEPFGTQRAGTGGSIYTDRSTTTFGNASEADVISRTLNKGIYLISITSSTISASAAIDIYAYMAIGGTQVTNLVRWASYVSGGYYASVSFTTILYITSDTTSVKWRGQASGALSGQINELSIARIA